MDGSVEPVNSEDLPSARLAAKVRELRAAQHLTQAQIAKRAGYTRTYVTLVESGTIVPGREVVARLDDALSAGGALLALRSEAESKRWAVQPASAPLSGPFEQPGTERPGPQFEPLAVVLARVESLSASTGGGGWVRGLELAIEDVVDRYEAEGPQRLSGEVVGLRRLVEDLRRDAPNKATGPQILGWRVACRDCLATWPSIPADLLWLTCTGSPRLRPRWTALCPGRSTVHPTCR